MRGGNHRVSPGKAPFGESLSTVNAIIFASLLCFKTGHFYALCKIFSAHKKTRSKPATLQKAQQFDYIQIPMPFKLLRRHVFLNKSYILPPTLTARKSKGSCRSSGGLLFSAQAPKNSQPTAAGIFLWQRAIRRHWSQ
jgi:hypothetical protein